MQNTCEELVALSEAWERAMVSNDANAIGRFMADDWIIISATGTVGKGAFLAIVASGDLTHETFQGEIISVREYGDSAIVTGRVRNNGTYRGKAFDSDEWTTDVFVRHDGQWKCVHSHITAVNK